LNKEDLKGFEVKGGKREGRKGGIRTLKIKI